MSSHKTKELAGNVRVEMEIESIIFFQKNPMGDDSFFVFGMEKFTRMGIHVVRGSQDVLERNR